MLRALLAAVAVIGMAAACCGGAGTLSSGTSGGSNTTPAAAKVGKVGDTITVDKVACTLVSVKTLQGDEFNKPKSGDTFIVVHVKLKNSGSSDFNYSQFDFKVKTSAGNVTDSTIPPSTYTANQELNSGALAPGGAAEGDVILEAPIGDHQAELSWQPSFFSQSTDNLWNLGL